MTSPAKSSSPRFLSINICYLNLSLSPILSNSNTFSSLEQNSIPQYKSETTNIMSFLTRAALRSTRVALAPAPRAFSTSFAAQKSATESVKDGVKTVDRAVSDKLVDGIELGRMYSLYSAPLFIFLVEMILSSFQNLKMDANTE
jgi:hypothetical protein